MGFLAVISARDVHRCAATRLVYPVELSMSVNNKKKLKMSLCFDLERKILNAKLI